MDSFTSKTGCCQLGKQHGLSPELSFVIPCLNEEESLGACIEAAHRGARETDVKGYEIVVADNGSTDKSVQIAEQSGARVVSVSTRGYGAALRGGIGAAKGKYVVMADADGSYDLADIGAFVTKLREGTVLVMGSRFKGVIKPGAMPRLNRHIGNPLLTSLGNLLFGSSLTDFHCGMRGFDREKILGLHLSTDGMEFASEMVIRATLAGQSIDEVPITLSPDQRSRPPHLRPWRDGWRHLRFMLIYSPRWLFLFPGLFLVILGLPISAYLLFHRIHIGSLTLDVHSLLATVTIIALGTQLITLGLFARLYASRCKSVAARASPLKDTSADSLEYGLAIGLILGRGWLGPLHLQLLFLGQPVVRTHRRLPVHIEIGHRRDWQLLGRHSGFLFEFCLFVDRRTERLGGF